MRKLYKKYYIVLCNSTKVLKSVRKCIKALAIYVKISKIVLTGGPCAGKTTALNWINNYFSKRGYTVLYVPETATELISNGVAPWTCGTNYDYQVFQIKLQKTKERIFEDAALTMDKEKILLVCDRGIMDAKAYVKDVEFKKLLFFKLTPCGK